MNNHLDTDDFEFIEHEDSVKEMPEKLSERLKAPSRASETTVEELNEKLEQAASRRKVCCMVVCLAPHP